MFPPSGEVVARQVHHAIIALLLTDMVMPGGMSGQELARRMQADKPGRKVVFMSGYSATIAGQEFQLEVGEMFIQKPFTAGQVFDTIRTTLHCVGL
jgi:FixJ family two-component response regulator